MTDIKLPPLRLSKEERIAKCRVDYELLVARRLRARRHEMGEKKLQHATEKVVDILAANHHTGAMGVEEAVEFLIYLTQTKHEGLVQAIVRRRLSLQPSPGTAEYHVAALANESHYADARKLFLRWRQSKPNRVARTSSEELNRAAEDVTATLGRDALREVLSRYGARDLDDVAPACYDALTQELKDAHWEFVCS